MIQSSSPTLAALTGWLLLTGCLQAPVWNDPGSDRLNRLVTSVQKAVVAVQTYDGNMKATGVGTGFFINADGHLITSHHVLDGAFHAAVKTADGERYPIERVLAENSDADLIKVSVDIPPEAMRWIRVTAEVPPVAERIVVVGTPLGLEQTVSEGIVSAIREIPGAGDIFQMSAPISMGSSGSPVVNRRGEVIGVVSFQSRQGQNLNFAVAGKSVIELADSDEPIPIAEWTYRKSADDPELVKSLCRTGLRFAMSGHFQEALDYYLAATERTPDDSEAWYGLGHCYVGLDQPREAIAAYREAIRTEPDNPVARYNLGRYYIELGQLEEAVALFREAAGVDPDYIPAFFDMAVALGNLGKTEEAISSYQAVIRINPDFFPAFHQMGIVYHRSGRHSEALHSQQRAIEINPDYAAAHLAIGLVWDDLDVADKARSAYRDALRIDPDLAAAHYRIALLDLENGDRGQALQEYKILKKLDEELAERLFEQIYR
ncbi:MAG: tetratricopeptide repeat protein [Desulfobacterales bacterium]